MIAIAISTMTASAAAQGTGPHQWLVLGVGNDSCASYVLALADNRPTSPVTRGSKTYYSEANAYTQWINGFVTAENVARKPGPGQIQVDVNGVALWVKHFCEANPSESIMSGARAFVRAHRRK
jgi:hypothetical protein